MCKRTRTGILEREFTTKQECKPDVLKPPLALKMLYKIKLLTFYIQLRSLG